MTYFQILKRALFLFPLLIATFTTCKGQIYKYLGIEDGLSNRRIFRIQKGGHGYMWFLTQEGIDRYDGSKIKHYAVFDGSMEVGAANQPELAIYRQQAQAVGCG